MSKLISLIKRRWIFILVGVLVFLLTILSLVCINISSKADESFHRASVYMSVCLDQTNIDSLNKELSELDKNISAAEKYAFFFNAEEKRDLSLMRKFHDEFPLEDLEEAFSACDTLEEHIVEYIESIHTFSEDNPYNYDISIDKIYENLANYKIKQEQVVNQLSDITGVPTYSINIDKKLVNIINEVLAFRELYPELPTDEYGKIQYEMDKNYWELAKSSYHIRGDWLVSSGEYDCFFATELEDCQTFEDIKKLASKTALFSDFMTSETISDRVSTKELKRIIVNEYTAEICDECQQETIWDKYYMW